MGVANVHAAWQAGVGEFDDVGQRTGRQPACRGRFRQRGHQEPAVAFWTGVSPSPSALAECSRWIAAELRRPLAAVSAAWTARHAACDLPSATGLAW